MATLTNESARGLGLPGRRGPDGAMRGALVLPSHASVDVPDWYVDEIALERGIASITNQPGGLRITRAAAKAPAPAAPAVPAPLPDLEPVAPKKTRKR